MLTGAHTIIYTKDPASDRAFFRDVLGLTHIDAGDGWLIFGLPPSEVAFHPDQQGDRQELFLLCQDIEAFVRDMARHGVTCGPIEEPAWGRLTRLTLPGGGQLGVYQPRHPRPGLPDSTPP
jgi:catechol 2,3-dioxygenase-like lactoylglutathione lyase family enzyme